MPEKNSCSCPHSTQPAPPSALIRTTDAGHPAHTAKQQLKIKIHNMDCPTEEKLIRHCLASVPGVVALDFDLLQRVLTVHHNLTETESIFSKLNQIGMAGQLVDPAHAHRDIPHPPAILRKQILLSSIAGVAALLSEILAWSSADKTSPVVIALAILAILTGGIPTLKKGWIALRHLNLNMHLLMTTAVSGAIALGQWPEAAVVICLFGLAEMLEAASLDRARNAIAGLMAQAPDTANVQQPDKQWLETAVSQIMLGQILRARAGERIALDGIVESGHSSVDQAAITGESMPLEKTPGDLVYAGTLNQSGNLEIRVTSLQGDTLLSRIAHSVQQAQSQRAPTQSLVDQFAARYTPAVFIFAILMATLPPLLGSSSWHDSIYQALVLLVIACPCALVISTPVTVVSGLALAAKRGILIKGGLYLEQGRKLSLIALDKTGTLTYGTPCLTDIVAVGQLSEQEILHIAASLEAGSQHPVAHAVLAAYSGELAQVSHFSSSTTLGVTGEIQGQRYYLGNQRMLQETSPELKNALHVSVPGTAQGALQARIEQLEACSKTVILLCDTHQVLGLFAVCDTLRASSKIAIRQLQDMGIKLIMLTGDNAHTAKAIAAESGISEVRSQLLPEEKLAAIAELSVQGLTGMVGDGVNDAPALARAHIGFAMGAAGSDTALETADVALMQDDLRKLPEFIRLSKRTAAILWQNIAFAIGIKVLFFALTLTGHSSMWMAVFADTGTSLLVILNGLRLLNYQDDAVASDS